MTRLEIRIDHHRVYFSGRIDDTAQLATLALPDGPVILDTDGVTFINSIGMREWIRFVRAAREGGRQITLDRVADVLMTQMNMINELHGLTVTSFHARNAVRPWSLQTFPSGT